MSSTVGSQQVAMGVSEGLGNILSYSPFAFASKELETAFQRDLPRRVGRIMARNVILGWGLTVAVTGRMVRNPNPRPDLSPALALLPLCGTLAFTLAAAFAFSVPNLFAKYWMVINTGLRLLVTAITLLTWESMPPEPVNGPLTLTGVVLSYFIGVLTPPVFCLPGSTPLPLLLHLPAQAALLGGLFLADSRLCTLRLASPDLPGQVDSLVKLITGTLPMLAPAFNRLPSQNCIFVVSFGQALATLGGTAIMVWQEISMRKAFLAEDATARVVLEGVAPQRIKNFPYGHPKGIVLFLSIFSASAITAAMLWEVFVFKMVSAA
eukprot:jgi/Botrbrau1/19994/Bobra.200_1s0004.1